MAMELRPCRLPLTGTLRPPSDKSITHRAILFSALAMGSTRIVRPLVAQDTLSSRRVVESLGVKVDAGRDEWVLSSPGPDHWLMPSQAIDCGNSGTTIRLAMGLFSLSREPRTLTGDASLSKRPMERVAHPLREMGIRVETTRGYPPVTVHHDGAIRGITYDMPMASAQVKSALILAALKGLEPSEIREPYPTRDHTERMLRQMGIEISQTQRGIRVEPVTQWQQVRPAEFQVPGDPSSAAFWAALAGLLPGSHLVLREVSVSARRTGFFRHLQQMGVHVDIADFPGEGQIGNIAVGYRQLRATTVDAAQVPDMVDEVPLVALMASQAAGETIITGAKELRVKETDRIRATVENLRTLGVDIEERPDGMIVRGPTPIRGGRVKTFGDHRMAMMLAVAAAVAQEPVILDDPDSVGISYPAFFERYRFWQQGQTFRD